MQKLMLVPKSGVTLIDDDIIAVFFISQVYNVVVMQSNYTLDVDTVFGEITDGIDAYLKL